MPLPDATFDFVVCTAAFKNFSNPLGALDEIPPRPQARRSSVDLRLAQGRFARRDRDRSAKHAPVNDQLSPDTVDLSLLALKARVHS
jgi:hypothetical protein